VKRRPWYKHDANDWLGDPELRRCSLKARGLLEDLMCIAHNSDRYGYLEIGVKPSDPEWIIELSQIVRAHHKEVSTAWQDLLKRHRIGIGSDGVPFIKRMVQDNQYSLQQSELGKTGGNPTLKAPLKVEESESESKSKSKIPPNPQGGEGESNPEEPEPEPKPPEPKKKVKRKRFVRPTPLEASGYARSIDFAMDGEEFCAFYESKGWMVGSSPMKSWQGAVVTWKKTHAKKNPSEATHKKHPNQQDLSKDMGMAL